MLRSILARLPLPLRDYLRGQRHNVRLLALRLYSTNGFLAGIYFALFSRKFRREHLAVLKGRQRYYEELSGGGQSSPLLRRNTHRLEKGLIMRPRRPVFAEGFIGETVAAYNRANESSVHSMEELQWAGDVLEEYFSVVADTPVVQAARDAFSSGSTATSPEQGERTPKSRPYPRAESPATSITFDELHRLFVRRRSVRWYLDKPVPMELVRRAIDAAAQAPSACNRQPFRFIVATDPEWAAKIAACAGGTTGFADQLPAIIVVVGNLAAYPLERDRHLIYIDSALASMQLMLSAETLGLSTCPINWPDVDFAEERIQTIIELPAHERVIMLIAIGYGDPESGVPYSQKKQGDLLAQEFPPG
jgi:nitroreductase